MTRDRDSQVSRELGLKSELLLHLGKYRNVKLAVADLIGLSLFSRKIPGYLNFTRSKVYLLTFKHLFNLFQERTMALDLYCRW